MNEKEIQNRARLHKQVYDAFSLEATELSMSKERHGKGFPHSVVIMEALSFGIDVVRENYGDNKALLLLRQAIKGIERGEEDLWENFEFTGEDDQ